MGGNSLLIKIYKHEEVMDLLIAARTKDKTSIEFYGGVEEMCSSRLRQAGFRVETFQNPQKVIVTVISW